MGQQQHLILLGNTRVLSFSPHSPGLLAHSLVDYVELLDHLVGGVKALGDRGQVGHQQHIIVFLFARERKKITGRG